MAEEARDAQFLENVAKPLLRRVGKAVAGLDGWTRLAVVATFLFVLWELPTLYGAYRGAPITQWGECMKYGTEESCRSHSFKLAQTYGKGFALGSAYDYTVFHRELKSTGRILLFGWLGFLGVRWARKGFAAKKA